MSLFKRRTARERFDYHRENEKKILAKTQGVGMTDNEKQARSAGWIACARENKRKYIWSRATDAERVAMQNLGKDKKNKVKLKQLWALERTVLERAKAENAKAKGKKGA